MQKVFYWGLYPDGGFHKTMRLNGFGGLTNWHIFGMLAYYQNPLGKKKQKNRREVQADVKATILK